MALKVKKDISNEVDEEHQIILKKIEKEKEAEQGEEIPEAYFQKEGYFWLFIILLWILIAWISLNLKKLYKSLFFIKSPKPRMK